jgi:hypothetical protein
MTSAIHKIKFFNRFQQDLATLENEINQWLADNPDIHIIHLTQCEMNSEQGRNIVVTMMFKNGPTVQAAKKLNFIPPKIQNRRSVFVGLTGRNLDFI